jgi:hypothetical protein
MWNQDKPWSATELDELEIALVDRMPLDLIARCFMRSAGEVREKVREIERASAHQ